MFARLTAFILLLHCSSLLAHADDGCPQHLRRCNAQCLDRTTNHTTPCKEGPWGKCLSATFPFFCPLTNTCIRKDELCGDACFNGDPGSIWLDHWTIGEFYNQETWIEKENQWKLEDGAYDTMKQIAYSLELPVWLERYNCHGKCTTYLESCNGGCDHPDEINKNKIELVKCGKECRTKDDMRGFHDCGEECLPQKLPCKGTCADSTEWMTGPQWKCGNECRPEDQEGIKWGKAWRECPDGSCRGTSVNCDGPLPGTCPTGQVLCRYSSWIRGTDFDCRDSSDYYVCKEDRASNSWGNIIGKHDDAWCNTYDELCEGECQPGFIKCMVDNPPTCTNCLPTCKNATEYIQCGDECKESRHYHNCDGTCLSTEDTCNDNCAEGFEKCGEKCLSSTEGNIVRCNGKCQTADELCDGKCLKDGWFKAGSLCKPESEKNQYHECNGEYLDLEMPCNGECAPKSYRKLCDGKCLGWGEDQDCNGECKPRDEVCNGKCYNTYKVPCGDHCVDKSDLCDGKCHHEEYPFKCNRWRLGETCLDAKLIGDGNKDCVDGSDEETTCYQGWMCDGKLQCINEPCHSLCPSYVNRTEKCFGCITREKSYAIHHCPEEGKCKLEGEPCNGACVVDMKRYWGNSFFNIESKDQFACHDGSKCLDYKKVCDGDKDCDDGSDEICRVRGCESCKVEVVTTGSGIRKTTKNFFHCKSGDQKISIGEFCDGNLDCGDGSDEKDCDKCPGIVRCNWNDDEFVCANIPCKNREDNELFCSVNWSHFLWDMCLVGSKQEATCVKRSWRGGSFTEYKGKPVEGTPCNGECLSGGVKCGDKCLPGFMGDKWACNGDCSHHKSDYGPLVNVDGHCLTKEVLKDMKNSGDVRKCDGEYRYFSNWPQETRDWASRRKCNGGCLSGDDGKDPWLPCATGNECYPAKEWCDGVNNCKDGSDEAKCKGHCKELVRCEHESHPLQNQTGSDGPGFPEYVCGSEPCGTCADPDTYPCGSYCISNEEKCHVTGQCSPTVLECGTQCVRPEFVCDGKVDCIGKEDHGADEKNCNNTYQGSWVCRGKIQSKTLPCL